MHKRALFDTQFFGNKKKFVLLCNKNDLIMDSELELHAYVQLRDCLPNNNVQISNFCLTVLIEQRIGATLKVS